jgi:hypothetical protein
MGTDIVAEAICGLRHVTSQLCATTLTFHAAAAANDLYRASYSFIMQSAPDSKGLVACDIVTPSLNDMEILGGGIWRRWR